MNRHEFLAELHQILQPRTYLEIGVNQGHSFALSRSRSIGVDPAFRIVAELECDLQLVKATSDDFFARPAALEWFGGVDVDLTFIDGMHIFEFALRDFINAERLGSSAGVVVFDDMLPRSISEAARDRHTMSWAGDVYKVAMVLEEYRPDLTVIAVDTEPTGVVMVVGLDPSNTTLSDRYDQILARYATKDPQDVPADILQRRQAAEPSRLLTAAPWKDVVAARATGAVSRESLTAMQELRSTATYTPTQRVNRPWPPQKSRTGAARKRPASKPESAWRRIAKAIRRP